MCTIRDTASGQSMAPMLTGKLWYYMSEGVGMKMDLEEAVKQAGGSMFPELQVCLQKCIPYTLTL